MATLSAVSIAAQRASLRVLSALAPSTVDRLIVDRFATPMRRRRRGDAPVGEPWMISSDNETISVYSAGDAPRVLFVHGWEGDAGDFAPLMSVFRDAGFGVASFDHPAHGKSSGTRATLPQMARATLDVGRAIGPVAAVIGHSLGASAALIAVANGLDARRAVLFAPPYDAGHFIRLNTKHMGLSDARAAGAIALLERRVGPIDGRATDRIASQIQVPGLVLHDSEDRYVPFAHGAAVAAAWPGARLVRLSGLGHRRTLADPCVHRDILSFVREE
jgi:pimeloyl-ACP methyl ester carboxylesterase